MPVALTKIPVTWLDMSGYIIRALKQTNRSRVPEEYIE